jgi:RecB family exonuclease
VTRDYLSYSAVSTFQQCPLRYYFKYVLGLPEKTVAASLVFGAAIHAAVQFHFEQLLAGNPAPDLDTLLEVFQDSWRLREGQNVQFTKGEDINTLGRLADRMLLAFRQSDFARPQGIIVGVEEELRGTVIAGCPDLLARLDLIVDTGEALVITDFKTSRHSWSSEQTGDAAPQLLLYSEVAKDLAEGKPVKLQFAVMTKTKVPELAIHPVPVDAQQVERTKRLVERVWQAIQGRAFYPSPSALNCSTCAFRKPCAAWTG